MINTRFEVPFYIYNINDWTNKKTIILNSLPNFKDHKLEKDKNSGHGDKNHYTDYFDNLKTPPSYSSVVLECINDEVLNFCKTINKNLNLTSLWFQSYEKYNNFSVHNHGIDGWSAILYVEFDNLEHSPTTFYSPYPSWKKEILGQYETYIPKVKEGDLIIFPSMIQHEASSNLSDKKRTIISFNLK